MIPLTFFVRGVLFPGSTLPVHGVSVLVEQGLLHVAVPSAQSRTQPDPETTLRTNRVSVYFQVGPPLDVDRPPGRELGLEPSEDGLTLFSYRARFHATKLMRIAPRVHAV